ncbi:MAG: hypothetical protein P1P88_17730 [Bacteroidales bacterium]|nr:hypothetical protein [Bacteroidales bacterium]
MKQKYTIAGALVLLIAVLAIMSWDLFFKIENQTGNQYEYNLDKLKQVDTNMLCYKENIDVEVPGKKIRGLAVDKDDNIYVTTENNVIIYNNKGEQTATFTTSQTANCISIGPDATIYVGFKDHIETYNPAGELIAKWDTINSSAYITSIAVDETSVFLADAGNKVVQQFNHKGQLINQIGKKDKEKGIPGLFIPSPYFDVLIGRDGELWAINSGRHAFEAYDKQGNLKSTWKRTSMELDGFSGCCNPSHVAMLSDGSFVTSEKGIERVKIVYANGDLKCVVAKPDQFVEGTTGLDLAVDSKDRILVLDPEKGMVRIFEII